MEKKRYIVTLSTDKNGYDSVSIKSKGGKSITKSELAELYAYLKEFYPEPKYLYVGEGYSQGEYKIGISIDPSRRANELGLAWIHYFPCSSQWYETKVLRTLKDLGLHIKGEWFRNGGGVANWVDEFKKMKSYNEAYDWCWQTRTWMSKNPVLKVSKVPIPQRPAISIVKRAA